MKTVMLAWIVALLVGCGGGEPDELEVRAAMPLVVQPVPAASIAKSTVLTQPITLSLYGDSFTATNPSTAAQITSDSGGLITATSFALGGSTTGDAITGTVVSKPFAEQMRTDKSTAIMLRYGIAEAVRGGHIINFTIDLETLIVMAKTSGHLVVLVNIVDLPESSVVTHVMKQKLELFNMAIAALSMRHGVPMIDLHKVFGAIKSEQVWEDGLHLLPETTAAVNTLLTEELKKAL